MTKEEKGRQVAVGNLLRHRRKACGYTIEGVVAYANKVGWKLNADKLNRIERGAVGHEITGLKTLMHIYNISCKEIADVR